ncbi:MAG: DsbA family protein [Pseudomonadota bacterium]
MIDRRRTLALLAGGTALAGGYVLLGRQGGSPAVDYGFPVGAANAQTIEIEDITMGDPDASVEIIEYASFTCPHCASFHQDTFKAFKAEYIDTGRVHFIYREVFFDRYGLWAAMIARCAGVDRYMGVADLIYQSQDDWARQGDPALVAESLKRIGAQAGLGQEEVDACLQDADMAQSLVSWYEANAERDGVRSTPSFVVNGDIHSGNMSLTQIGQLVDDAAS